MSGDPAPGDLALVEAFVNTRGGRTRPDVLRDPANGLRWLADHGILPASEPFSADDAAAAVRAREALRALLLANNGGPPAPAAAKVLSEQAQAAPLVARIAPDGSVTLGAGARGWSAALARLLSVIERAQAAGTWSRLKACPDDTCQWAFYDHSRNRSRTWCDMAVCGNRAKARAYRRRTG